MELPGALHDGVLLCQLVNKVQPGMIQEVFVIAGSEPGTTNLQTRKNVDNFVECCHALGLTNLEGLKATDILQGQGNKPLLQAVRQLLSKMEAH